MCCILFYLNIRLKSLLITLITDNPLTLVMCSLFYLQFYFTFDVLGLIFLRFIWQNKLRDMRYFFYSVNMHAWGQLENWQNFYAVIIYKVLITKCSISINTLTSLFSGRFILSLDIYFFLVSPWYYGLIWELYIWYGSERFFLCFILTFNRCETHFKFTLLFYFSFNEFPQFSFGFFLLSYKLNFTSTFRKRICFVARMSSVHN